MRIRKQDIYDEIDMLSKAKEKIEKFLKTAPEGTLRITRRGKCGYYWYHQTKRGSTYHNRYLAKKDEQLARKLAQKSYYKEILADIENEIEELNCLAKIYYPEKKYERYSLMPESRQDLVNPLFDSAEYSVKKWLETPYEPWQEHEEYLRFKTDNGEMVRSKSEMIIANKLKQRENDVLYHYEQPLYLKKGKRTVHPDFTLINRHTGQILYWEHVGRLDDPGYVADFINKINGYIANGIFPGINLVLTFENSKAELNIGTVDALIDKYFGDELMLA